MLIKRSDEGGASPEEEASRQGLREAQRKQTEDVPITWRKGGQGQAKTDGGASFAEAVIHLPAGPVPVVPPIPDAPTLPAALESDLEFDLPEPTLVYCGKPGHGAVPYVTYGANQWCRICEANRHASKTYLRNALALCHWGIVVSLPLLVFGLSLLAPLTRNAGRDLSREHYLYLVFPAMFIVVSLVSGLVHRSLRRADKAQNGRLGVARWYNPNLMVKDWLVVGAAFSFPYAAIMFYGGPHLPVANTIRDYLVYRATLILALAVLLLPALNRMKIITPHTLIPAHGWGAALQFGTLTSVGFLLMHHGLSLFAQQNPDRMWLYAPLALTLFFLLLYLGMALVTRLVAGQLKGSARLPLPATLAMIGPSNVGKTVFLTRAYSLLENSLQGHMSAQPTETSRRKLEPIVHRIETERKWPLPTQRREVNSIPFFFKRGNTELIHFDWMDLPGGAFTRPNDYSEARQRFDAKLVNSDAVVMLFDALDLVQAPDGDSIPHMKIYRENAEKLHQRLKEVGHGARPVPLALIITKSGMVDKSQHRRIVALLDGLADRWRYLAKEAKLGRPAVETFLADAVVIPYEKDRVGNPPIPPAPAALLAMNCREPLYWLAAQVLRVNVGVMDSVAGFAVGSDVQRTVTQLEMLAKK